MIKHLYTKHISFFSYSRLEDKKDIQSVKWTWSILHSKLQTHTLLSHIKENNKGHTRKKTLLFIYICHASLLRFQKQPWRMVCKVNAFLRKIISNFIKILRKTLVKEFLWNNIAGFQALNILKFELLNLQFSRVFPAV